MKECNRKRIHLESSEEDHSPITGRTSHTCDRCGKTFQAPMLAAVSTSGQVERYYACPWCMTKVDNVKIPDSGGQRKLSTSRMKRKKSSAEPEKTVKCQYFFGYLRKRAKEAAVPEQCLTCKRMFECLFHEAKSQD